MGDVSANTLIAAPQRADAEEINFTFGSQKVPCRCWERTSQQSSSVSASAQASDGDEVHFQDCYFTHTSTFHFRLLADVHELSFSSGGGEDGGGVTVSRDYCQPANHWFWAALVEPKLGIFNEMSGRFPRRVCGDKTGYSKPKHDRFLTQTNWFVCLNLKQAEDANFSQCHSNPQPHASSHKTDSYELHRVRYSDFYLVKNGIWSLLNTGR